MGGHIEKGLHALKKKHSIIGDVRGKGLMLGVELVKDRDTKVCPRLKVQHGDFLWCIKHPCAHLTLRSFSEGQSRQNCSCIQ